MKWIGLFSLALVSGFGQSAPAAAFEVASIRPTIFPKGTFGFSSGGPAVLKTSGNTVTATFTTIRSLLMYAYGVSDYQIVSGGSPRDAPWSDFYEIAAKTLGESAPNQDQLRQMLQGLLADRFQLKLHRETRELPVYNLIVGKSGSKLKESAPDTKPGGNLRQGPVTRIQFSNRPISDLVRSLNLSYSDRPVLDKTGLEGGYDFTLEFSAVSKGDLADGATPDTNPIGASIFRAVQEQLGLKLKPAKEPTEVLVIDYVASHPSDN